MASLDQQEAPMRAEPPMKEKPKAESKKGGGKEVNPDAKLVSMMGMAMLDKGGLDQIKTALSSSQDPGQVVAQFIAQMAGRLAEYTSAEMDIDPGVFAQPNGFIDQILGYIEKKLGLPEEFSDQVYGEVLEVMKAAAAQPPQGQEQAPAGPPQQAAPPAPGPAPAGLDQGVM